MLYHLEDIEKIREVEKEVSNNGYKVFDISHWDLSLIHICLQELPSYR